MVRTIVIDETLKSLVETDPIEECSCFILIGNAVEEKRFVCSTFIVRTGSDCEDEFANSTDQLLYSLPGGLYPVGIFCNEKTMPFLNILRKAFQRLQKLVSVNEVLFEPFVITRVGKKVESRVLLDGQLKPITLRYQPFFSTWNQISTYIRINNAINLPKLDDLKKWKSSFRASIIILINSLSALKIHFPGSKIKDDKSFLDDPGKGKNASNGKTLQPSIILPLLPSEIIPSNSTLLIGSLYTHVYLPPKCTVEQVREILLEDIAKSLYSRGESYCEFLDQDGKEMGVSETRRLPYRVTFPIKNVELSVYLLQDEKISQAAQVATDLFDLYPTSINTYEECSELCFNEGGSALCLGEEEEDGRQLKNIVMVTLGGVIALLASVVIATNTLELT
eukprot:sb/3465483/